MKVAVVGAGRVGTALAVLLAKAGHRIVAVSGGPATAARAARFLPGTPVLSSPDAARLAELILIGTSDDRIEPACAELAAEGALGPGRIVAHLSGATGLDALASARRTGARVLSIHPLQTLPDVEAALERIPGSPVAVTALDGEAFALGERLAGDVGGWPFRLADEEKPLYHAASVFASNYLFVIAAIGEDLLRKAEVDAPMDKLGPLLRASVENVLTMGPEVALTGPAMRGDAGTIARQLEVLSERAPKTVAAYVVLARVALDLGERSGRLSAPARTAVEEVLDRWR